MRAFGIEGLSVTTPHKDDVARLVDRRSVTAERLGAVNAVVRRGGDLVGESTDGQGFIDAVRVDHGFDPDGRRCVVRGSGGAARAIVLALAGAGAAEVIVVPGRSTAKAETAAALAGPAGRVGDGAEAAGADLVVNATTIGMAVSLAVGPGPGPGPGTGPGAPGAAGTTGAAGAAAGPADLPIDPSLLGAGQLVVDIVYPTTPFVLAARRRGATAADGLGMLLHQAAGAFRLWTGQDPPLEVMSAAALAAIGHAD